ncbi:MAG: hydrogenase maturation nickel metallochaperone HypA [Bryobacteraceae bacterium]
MHETGIAWSILEMANREAARAGAPLSAVGVRLGEMSGVVEEALSFAFDALKVEAGAAEAELVVERVSVEALCPQCGSTTRPEGELILWCPQCGSPMRIVSGEQMEIAWIEVHAPARSVAPAAAASSRAEWETG